MNNRRSPIYLITGLIIGLALGIAYGWVLTPVEVIETQPQDLRSDFKDAYRELIARAFQSSHDLGRASLRLALLGDDDPVRALAVQAQITLGRNGSEQAARALGALAEALQAGAAGPPAAAQLPDSQIAASPTGSNAATNLTITATRTEASATPTATQSSSPPTNTPNPSGSPPPPTFTPTASPTPTATPGPPFVLLDIPLECNPSIDPPLIRVFVVDGSGNPVPGVAILVSWDGNTNRFVTGLKPEYGLGYADFTMDPLVTYSLRLEAGGDPISSITGRLCEDQDEPYWGSWRLNFVQP